MNEEITFKHLTEVLSVCGEKLVDAYKKEIAGHKASGKLEGSISYTICNNGVFYELSLEYEDYLNYLLEGTRPHFPPVKDILSWIKVKPIVPKPMKNGKLPTQEQLAYLIGRKISKDGTKGIKNLDSFEDRTFYEILVYIDTALETDLEENMDQILESLVK